MAAAAPEAAPTFNWTGMGQPEGARIHYQSFNFAGQHYTMGDCVYLLPEEEGSQPYIGRLMRAYEDTTAKEAERLVIEVQWFEPRASLPPAVAAGMHEQEVVESDLIDTNLVGCLDSKATIIQASSYEEAYGLLPPGHTGQWHFCRGTWDTERQVFRSYLEMGAMPGCYTQGFAPGAAAAMYQQYQQAALNGYGDPDQDYLMDDEGADLTPRSGGGRARGGRSRRSTAARSSAAVNAAAAAAAAAAASGSAGAVGYSQRSGIPGKVCCECGATQTPQWREGPKGPKTLCNACGVRYQRQQSKAKSNKRLAADRGSGKDRGSSPAPHGGRNSKHARLSAASAGNTPDAAAAAAATMEDAFSAAALETHQLQQLQMAQLLNGTGGDPTDPAAAAAAPAPAHHHGTRRNAKAAAAAAAVGGSPRGFRSSRQQQRGGGSLSGSDLAAGGGSSGGGSAGKGGHNTAMSAGKGEGAAGAAAAAAAGKHKGPGHPALAAALAAAGEQMGFYSDERSPPNSNTRILEYEDEDGGQQQQQRQQQQRQDLARSNTHEAADALQNLAHNSQGHQHHQQQQQQQLGNHAGEPQQQQQQQAINEEQQAQQQRQQEQQRQRHVEQQQQQQAAAAATATAGFFSALGSPATALLIAEQGMPSDSMPLLSLDDKYRPGTPSGLGVNDGLDGMNTNSLSPLKPHAQHMLTGSAAAAGAAAANAANGGLPIGRDGSTTSMPRYGMTLSGPGAVCASPGRLISAMVQNLKLPAPLALNPGLSPLGAATTLGMPSASNMSQQQQHQQHPGMLADLLAGTGSGVGDSSSGGNRQQQHGDVGAGQHMGMDAGGVGAAVDGNDNRLLVQLRSLLYRASSYTPDVSGLSGLYPGPATPRSFQQLVDQLEALPESDKARVQQASTAIEDSMSKAKAAEAAVLAVTQVLATKQNAAAETKAEVERSVLQLRCVLNQLNPAVAAAAAGSGGYKNAAATPTAADTAATAAAANAAAAAAAASNGLPVLATGTSGYLGQSFALSNGTGLSNGAGGMLGLAQGVGHPYGLAAVMAQGPMTVTDTDDLLRDPDDVPAAAAAPQQQQQQPQQQLTQMQMKQEVAAGLDGTLTGIDQQVQDRPQQQQQRQQQQQQEEAAPARQEEAATLASSAAAGNGASDAANGPANGPAPMAAAEPAPVAA